MILLIKLLIWGKYCEHKYETIATGSVTNYRGDFVARAYHCRCSKCGALKLFRL